jgi:hypothetical protein
MTSRRFTANEFRKHFQRPATSMENLKYFSFSKQIFSVSVANLTLIIVKSNQISLIGTFSST